MPKIKYVIAGLATIGPLLYLSWIAIDILSDYQGRCAGLLDAVGPICTKSEYLLDFVFSVFVFPILVANIIAYEFVLGIVYIGLILWVRWKRIQNCN